MVATDGHRLAHIEKPGETLDEHQRREEDADSAQGAVGAAVAAGEYRCGVVGFADDEHTLFFRIGHRTLTHAAS